MSKAQHTRLRSLEGKVPPTLQRVFTHYEGEALPDSYNPAKDRVITYVETDMRVYPDETRH